MNLAAELAAGFSEGAEPIATRYRLTNDEHSGVMRGFLGNAELTEPGIVPQSGLVIVESVANFKRPPSPEESEIVDVLEGQFAGKWVLSGVTVDNAHYVMTCYASE